MDIYEMATSDSDGKCPQVGPAAPEGYRPRGLFACQSPQRSEIVPTRVVLAMRFVEMCNSYTHPKGFAVGNHDNGTMSATVQAPELPATQDAAMRFACKCLGDYFAGKEIPNDQWQ